MIKSVCLVRLSALGDVLMVVPLVRTLQAAIPALQLSWVISRPAYELVEGMDAVEFILIDKPKNPKDYWAFWQRMRGREFDLLLAAQASFRANLLYPCIKAKRKIGYDRIRAKDGHGYFIDEAILPGEDHTLDGFLKFAKAIGIAEPSIRWDMPIGSAERDWARAQIPPGEGPLMLVNAAASKPERSWLIDRYLEAIFYAEQQYQARVLLIGGPGAYDRELESKLQQGYQRRYAAKSLNSIVGQSRPKQLLALIEAADLLLCPDTGPSHMASAVSTPVIALHAVTSAEVSGSYLYRDLAVDYYSEAVEKVLKKTKQSNLWGTHAHGENTMELVPTAAVLKKIDQVLGR